MIFGGGRRNFLMCLPCKEYFIFSMALPFVVSGIFCGFIFDIFNFIDNKHLSGSTFSDSINRIGMTIAK